MSRIGPVDKSPKASALPTALHPVMKLFYLLSYMWYWSFFDQRLCGTGSRFWWCPSGLWGWAFSLVDGRECSQTIELNFCGYFWRFLTLFATLRLLFGALNSTASESSGAVCGQTCGQRALLNQVWYNCRSLFRRALFRVQVWSIVPL